MNVFIVTQGNYSGYHICGVFAKEPLAQKFIDSFKDNQYNEMRIEVWELNPFKLELAKEYKPYFIRMDKEGNTLEIHKTDSTYSLGEGGFDIHFNMYLHCFAKDEAHAIKIANEKRTQLIAKNEWRDNGTHKK